MDKVIYKQQRQRGHRKVPLCSTSTTSISTSISTSSSESDSHTAFETDSSEDEQCVGSKRKWPGQKTDLCSTADLGK